MRVRVWVSIRLQVRLRVRLRVREGRRCTGRCTEDRLGLAFLLTEPATARPGLFAVGLGLSPPLV